MKMIVHPCKRERRTTALSVNKPKTKEQLAAIAPSRLAQH